MILLRTSSGISSSPSSPYFASFLVDLASSASLAPASLDPPNPFAPPRNCRGARATNWGRVFRNRGFPGHGCRFTGVSGCRMVRVLIGSCAELTKKKVAMEPGRMLLAAAVFPKYLLIHRTMVEPQFDSRVFHHLHSRRSRRIRIQSRNLSMASAELERKAKDAFFDDNFELAVDLFTEAISLVPDDSGLFADRAQANIKLKNFTEAVADANKAIELDPVNAKAYFRKGVACMKLEEYPTAKTALEKGASLAPSDSRFKKRIEECDELIAAENLELPKHAVELGPPQVATPNNLHPDVSLTIQGTSAVAPKPKYRHEFYQKMEEVVVTVFAKGIPASNVHIDFGEQILSVKIDVPGEDAYHFQPRLFGKIVPEKCRYDVMSTKVEIRLHKADNLNWASLEYRKDVVFRTTNAPAATQRLPYPSSKSKTADWDKLEAQVKKEEKEEKLDGDAGVNKFFRELYADADEDARRAMKKSLYESNGTVLSTNWKEVGAKKVEGSPPDGMELRKWEI